jgi:hypothetical protein
MKSMNDCQPIPVGAREPRVWWTVRHLPPNLLLQQRAVVGILAVGYLYNRRQKISIAGKAIWGGE